MALNAAKIRLGAPSSIVFTVGGTPIDLGATQGGCELTYNPTNFNVEIDQATPAVAAFKTKEELTFTCALTQYQVNLINAAFSYATTNVTTVAGTPSTDTAYIGNNFVVSTGTLDVSIPKSDGTTNVLLIHLNKVYSAKSIKLGFYREKNTALEKVEFFALADLTQAVGQQLGWVREQY